MTPGDHSSDGDGSERGSEGSSPGRKALKGIRFFKSGGGRFLYKDNLGTRLGGVSGCKKRSWGEEQDGGVGIRGGGALACREKRKGAHFVIVRRTNRGGLLAKPAQVGKEFGNTKRKGKKN